MHRHQKKIQKKLCLVCARPFSWRKKWADCWLEVKYCSKACQSLRRTQPPTSAGEVSEVIRMAWADDIPFEAIREQFALNESNVRKIMLSELKPSSFRLWRKRVAGRATKHKMR